MNGDPDKAETKNPVSQRLTIRQSEPSDHPRIMAAMPDWWGGRDLRTSVPRLFLDHFCNTSFVAEDKEALAGFLVGFFSPARTEEGYVHFTGIAPEYRKRGLGRALYEAFFDLCRQNGRTVVRACTSPVNRDSVAFHQKMGFFLEPGDGQIDGIFFTHDYNRPGDPKVRLTLRLDNAK